MNFWKPLAAVSMVTTVLSVGYQAARANPAPQPPLVQGQPHMEAALEHLKQARAELDKAEHNKAGWRDAAIRDTQSAIDDTKRGMAAADH